MTLVKVQRPALEGVVIFIGGILAIIAPAIVVPIALSIALAEVVLTKARKKNSDMPTLLELVSQGRVVVTTRVVLLLLFGTLPLMVVESHYQAVSACVIYNLVILALIITDMLISTRPENLMVERRVASKLSIGKMNEVELDVTNQSYKAVQIELIDEFPESFAGNRKEVSLSLPLRSKTSLSYQVTPFKRGRYYFQNTIIRYRSTLELVIFQKAYAEPARVEVYPDITSIAKFELIMKRSHLIENGLVSERRRGSGTDFESLREYVKGDEFRKIDWKASARRNKLISREYQSEVNQSVIIMVDCSQSMGAVSDKLTILDHAVNGALLLGHQIMRKGDKVGLLTFSDRAKDFLPPNRGKNHFFSFVRHLYAIEADKVNADYESALGKITATRLKRSMLMIITDLTSGEAVSKMLKSIPLVSRKHLPVVVSIIDPVVKKAADELPASPVDVYQKVVARNIISRIKALTQKIEQMGVATVMVTPKQLNSSLLSQYLKVKLRSRL